MKAAKKFRDHTNDVKRIPYHREVPEAEKKIEKQNQKAYKGGENRYRSELPIQNIKPRDLLNLYPLVD